MLWRCQHCHASGISTNVTVEADEVDHFLASGCNGRCVAERIPDPPLKAFAKCAVCLELVEGQEVSRDSWNHLTRFMFECHRRRLLLSADMTDVCRWRRSGSVLFSEIFGSVTPVLLHLNP